MAKAKPKACEIKKEAESTLLVKRAVQTKTSERQQVKKDTEAAKKLADKSAGQPSDCVSALTTLPDKHGQQERGASQGASLDCSMLSAGQVEAETSNQD